MTISTPAFRLIAQSDAVDASEAIPFYLEDRKLRLTIARTEQGLFAFEDLCPHDRAPLSSGILTNCCIMCPCDGSLFDLATGDVVSGPSAAPLLRVGVIERHGFLYARVIVS